MVAVAVHESAVDCLGGIQSFRWDVVQHDQRVIIAGRVCFAQGCVRCKSGCIVRCQMSAARVQTRTARGHEAQAGCRGLQPGSSDFHHLEQLMRTPF
jgi:hypothetical protein